MSYDLGPIVLEVPEPEYGQTNPGNLEPRQYHLQELVELLRTHKNDPEVIQFIADMMEE
jgi:hypothetical protein